MVMVLLICELELLLVCPAKSGDHWHCDTGDLMFLICHMTSNNHLFRGLYNFIVESPSKWVNNLSCFPVDTRRRFNVFKTTSCVFWVSGQWYSTDREITYLIYHMISKDHIIEGSCDWVEVLYVYLHLSKFGGQRHCDCGDIVFLTYHIISQDLEINDWYESMDGSTSWQVTSLIRLMAIGIFA